MTIDRTVDRTIDKASNDRGDMSAFAENFPHEDFFMQQARKNGAEVGAPDPTVGVGGLIHFVVSLISAKSIVEIGTGSGFLMELQRKQHSLRSIQSVNIPQVQKRSWKKLESLRKDSG